MASSKTPEQFWLDRPTDLFRSDNWTYIIPNDNMTSDEKLNAVFRFCCYLGLLLLMIRLVTRSLTVNSLTHCAFVPLIGAVGTIAFHNANAASAAKKKAAANETEVFDNEMGVMCTRPTPQNPFMNLLLSDLKDDPSKPAACDIEDHRVRNKMDEYFDRGLFRDVDDVFHRNTSERQFYTMPVTTAANDAGAFASWLYGATGKIRDSYGGPSTALLGDADEGSLLP